ncbi:MAG: prolipoprotein diacylglyceryl transferase family protein [Kofleriaceae bacterium]
MTSLPASCARPWVGTWSTYTVLGLIGYVVAAIAVGLVGARAGAPTAERLVAIAMPAVGFLIAVWIARAIAGAERIVFYQTAAAAWLAAVGAAAGAGLDVARVSDLVVLLIASFLAFGRVGCFHVACCHGRPARFGVRYTEAHLALGFPARWIGRTLLPVQLIEAAVSAILAIACGALVIARGPDGTATVAFVVAYALVRFPLELVRGDSGRPQLGRFSEAQWTALATTLAAALVRPSAATVAATGALVALAVVVAWAQRALVHQLRRPRHLDEMARAHHRLRRDPALPPLLTTAGLRISVHPLPGARLDIVWSHPALSALAAARLAGELFARARIEPGAATGLVHVIAPEDEC